MKSITTHTGKLEVIERLPNSRNGNPRYLCRIDGWLCATKPDSMLGYTITNHDSKTVKAEIGAYYGKATINNIWA